MAGGPRAVATMKTGVRHDHPDQDIIVTGLREAAPIAADFVPGEAELVVAPLLSKWP